MSTNSRTRRKYSDREKAEALAMLSANGGNVLKTARELNIPERTLNDWSHLERNAQNPNSRHMTSPGYAREIAQLRDGKEKELAAMFEQVARKYLAHAYEDSVVNNTRGRDAVFSAAIAVDKVQVLRGQPTQIVEHLDVHQLVVLLRESLTLSPGTGTEDEES